MRMWRNWQTRMVQVHVPSREWRFKSSHPHQLFQQDTLENGPQMPGSRQAPGSNRLAKLLDRSQICRHHLAVGELGRAIAALGVQEIEQGQGAAPVGVFADVAAALRHVEIAGSKELSYPRALL